MTMTNKQHTHTHKEWTGALWWQLYVKRYIRPHINTHNRDVTPSTLSKKSPQSKVKRKSIHLIEWFRVHIPHSKQECRDIDREINRKIESLFFPLSLWKLHVSLVVLGSLFTRATHVSLFLSVCVRLYRLISLEFRIQSMKFIWVCLWNMKLCFWHLINKHSPPIQATRIWQKDWPKPNVCHTNIFVRWWTSPTSLYMLRERRENISPNFPLNMKVIIFLLKSHIIAML